MTAPTQYRNLAELCARSVEQFGDRPRFAEKVGGQWNWITFAQFGAQVDAFRAGLASLGVGRGDRVAAISNNRVEWAVGAYATYGREAVFVPMYEKQQPSDWEFILADSGAKVVIVANDKIAGIVRPMLETIGGLEVVVNLAGGEDDPHSYKSLLKAGREAPTQRADPAPEDLAGLIYTSGTTGKPKGVCLSHGNFTSNVNAVQTVFPMDEIEIVSLSFLPWAHSFGQTAELHVLFAFGGASAINSSLEVLVDELGEVKPTVFYAVPRLYNKIYDGLHKKIGGGGGLKAKLFYGGLECAKRRAELAEKGKSSGMLDLKYGFYDRLVFSKVRERLGGRLQLAFSGGAAISEEVMRFLDYVGVTIFEGYGLSETSPIATMNTPDHRRVGTVGKPIPGVKIIIAKAAVGGEMGEQGEIVIKGPNIMQGYYNLPDKTQEVMCKDGSFRSGDLGYVDGDGFLHITGRIKEQYKLENGKYVVPSPLEGQLQLNGFIAQAMVYGMNKLNNVAIIFPDFAQIREWAEAEGHTLGDEAAICQDERVRARVKAAIEKQHGAVFKGFEKIRDFRLITEEFTVDNDMLTPKMSLKRRNVIKAYQGLIDEMYG